MNPPPAGWYPDPQRPGVLRWFDGQAWTDHRTAAQIPAGRRGVGTSPGTSSGTRVLIIVASVVGGFFVLGILAAIAIPLFLNQREKASVAELASLTCAQVATEAVAMSQAEVTVDGIPLVAMTDAVIEEDARATLEVPEPGSSEVFAMSCSGTGEWGDGYSTPVTVEVYLSSDRERLLSISWGEGPRREQDTGGVSARTEL